MEKFFLVYYYMRVRIFTIVFFSCFFKRLQRLRDGKIKVNMFFETTVVSKCVPATFRVVAAVISVDGSVFGEMVADKEARSNMKIKMVHVIKKIRRDLLTALLYCTGILHWHTKG